MERDQFAFELLCAFNGIEPDKAPDSFWWFHNESMRDAWLRVEAKAREMVEREGNTMKLYIWRDPYEVEYRGSSVCYAVAENVERARELAKDGLLRKPGMRSGCKPPPIALGEPDHVRDLPCAEWYEWSE